jgi:hypothetical protein
MGGRTSNPDAQSSDEPATPAPPFNCAMARVLEYIKIQCSGILPHQAAPYNTLIKLPARLGGTSHCMFKLNISPNPTFINSFALGFVLL